MVKPCFGLPLGEGDFNKRDRVDYLLDLSRRTPNARMLVELKGDSIEPDGWIREFHREFYQVGGQMCWHPGTKLTKKMTDVKGILTPELQLMAQQADRLRREFGLLAVTVHLMPAVQEECSPNAGLERYNSPIGAGDMLDHILSQVYPLRQLNRMMGGILHIETLDITNFSSGGCRLPTYLALQTGAWLDLAWLARKTEVHTTADSEHMLCAANLLQRQRDLIDLPEYPVQLMPWGHPQPWDHYTDLERLCDITGYWLEQDKPPRAEKSAKRFTFRNHLYLINPHLFHFGGAVQANLNGTLGTHLPYDEDNQEQMDILDLQLRRLKAGWGIGGVVEVVGQLDPARYDPWSPRIVDDEEAKRNTLEVVLRRWTKIAG